ncbi:hypothetical protein [Streptomyces sp. AcE210]|uniref:hypothetical protein n=1 Tax=Streptomyces sp. AcE210 TaxID=2292703 RepID=UPI000E300D40|nr:hypothetical protein [Streptomyces sp. AcE210]RFC70912.1 hypothetical protein DXZ75_27205 [Streptomyces sp. AcE210]
MTSNNKTARTLSRVGVTVALALLVVGCSPAERPLVAIGKGPDGDVRALLRPCSDDDHVREVVFLRSDERGDRADRAALDGWSAQPPGSVTGEQEFSLFSPPKGWLGKAGSVTKLASGGDYSVGFVVGPDEIVRYKGLTRFTGADIEGLAPGQWWADGKAMSRAEFRAQADDACS